MFLVHTLFEEKGENYLHQSNFKILQLYLLFKVVSCIFGNFPGLLICILSLLEWLQLQTVLFLPQPADTFMIKERLNLLEILGVWAQ